MQKPAKLFINAVSIKPINPWEKVIVQKAELCLLNSFTRTDKTAQVEIVSAESFSQKRAK